mgnify:CR=1 FL=1
MDKDALVVRAMGDRIARLEQYQGSYAAYLKGDPITERLICVAIYDALQQMKMLAVKV